LNHLKGIRINKGIDKDDTNGNQCGSKFIILLNANANIKETSANMP
jgi:hypothetical protein